MWLRNMVMSLLVGAAFAAAAQQAQIPGRWTETRSVNRAADNSLLRSEVSVTPTEDRALNAVLRQLDRGYRAAAALNPPQGFEVRLVASTNAHSGSRESGNMDGAAPIPLSVQLLCFALFRDCAKCPVLRANEANPVVSVWINDPTVAYADAGLPAHSAAEPHWYMAARPLGTESGFTVHEGGYGRIIFARSSRPVHLPVSREDYLRRLIQDLNQKNAAGRQQAAAQGDAQSRALAEMEASIRVLKRSQPAAAAEMQKALDQSRAQLAATAAERDHETAQGFASARSAVAAVERELAQLSAAERRSPAYLVAGAPAAYRDAVLYERDDLSVPGDTSVRTSGLVAATHPGGRLVVRMNPDFFDRTLPRTTPQILVLESHQGGDASGAENDPEALQLRRDLFRSLNWEALQQIVTR